MNQGHQYAQVPYEGNNAQGHAGQGDADGRFSMKSAASSSVLSMCFFAAGCCIMIGSFLSFFTQLFSFKIVDLLNFAYMFIFGAILAILDTPRFSWLQLVRDYQAAILKYVKILTRITGKGVIFVFCGSTLLSAMWTTSDMVFMKVISVLLNVFVILVGFCLITVGYWKSAKLRRSQMSLANGDLEGQFHSYARTHGPGYGLTTAEFNNLTHDNGGVQFEDVELRSIFIALSSSANAPIPQGQAEVQHRMTLEDMRQWIGGGMVYL
eukprot:TRINITY_DN7932_c0_g1_i2.p1 TRINITY_DN7932_c0_g1~~TRINITY_DN7932_c0_g1_i2.p1  ORF type:complete len:266 (+),score=33.04 TRINITY_DN7932_c0_g1_i2:116-913(+)